MTKEKGSVSGQVGSAEHSRQRMRGDEVDLLYSQYGMHVLNNQLRLIIEAQNLHALVGT